MIVDYLNQAVEELKRVNHLVYVSLKYTRTVDVLLNIINRMVDGYTEMWGALLQKLVYEGKIEEVPDAPLQRTALIKEHYDDEETQMNVDLYHLLRKLYRSNPEREQEFRRHVTMRTIIDGREEIVNIDVITQYHHIQRDFLNHLYERFDEDIKQEEARLDEEQESASSKA